MHPITGRPGGRGWALTGPLASDMSEAAPNSLSAALIDSLTEFRLTTTFIPIIIIMYNWYLSLIQSFQYIHEHELQYTYTWRIPLASISPCHYPFSPPLYPFYLLGTLLAVTGIVHLGLRLLVN